VTLEQLEDMVKELNTLIQENLNLLTAGPPELKQADIAFKRDPNGPHFLGQGSFGKVYKGTLGGTRVAIKIPTSKVVKLDEFIGEVRIMRKVFHPNVVMLIGACTNPEEVIIVSELMEMDLEHYIQSPKYATEPIARRVKIAKDIALGLNWLHGVDIIHRDLKLGNILLDQHHTAKIADFGFSLIKKTTESFFKDKVKPKGNVLYMAPEVMQLQQFNQTSDVYSYGLIFWEILTGTLWDPPPQYATADTYKKFICELGRRPEITVAIPKKLAELIQQCWSKDPSLRPTLKQVISTLNDFLVDDKIDIPEARTFWKKHFLNTETAEFDETAGAKYFMKLVRRNLAVPKEELGGLRAILTWNWVDSNPKVNRITFISMEKFNMATKMFGNFFLPEKKTVLTEMCKWVKRKWFHGDIDLDTAHARLRNREPGFFIIRLSLSRPGYPFTITYMTSKKGREKVENARIRFEEDPATPGAYRYVTRRHDTDPPKFHQTLGDAIKNCGFYLSSACPREKVTINY